MQLNQYQLLVLRVHQSFTTIWLYVMLQQQLLGTKVVTYRVGNDFFMSSEAMLFRFWEGRVYRHVELS